ncbi:hypothetical protein AK812_SmicGene15283 [Symbiodinium microadriaticum]|uniref:Uncharacterized protein n=1 Tax=Symbiodinium microadriaticum TaxID=2951 RepID=A0A1Q9E3E9_SYMMI|nr:hypothetical protein AK812_SmicGene15283 [Symbiodinium microadriaticum]
MPQSRLLAFMPPQWQKGLQAAGRGRGQPPRKRPTRPQPIRVAPPQAAPYPVGKQQGQAAEPGGKGTAAPATVKSPSKPLPLPAGKRTPQPLRPVVVVEGQARRGLRQGYDDDDDDEAGDNDNDGDDGDDGGDDDDDDGDDDGDGDGDDDDDEVEEADDDDDDDDDDDVATRLVCRIDSVLPSLDLDAVVFSFDCFPNLSGFGWVLQLATRYNDAKAMMMTLMVTVMMVKPRMIRNMAVVVEVAIIMVMMAMHDGLCADGIGYLAAEGPASDGSSELGEGIKRCKFGDEIGGVQVWAQNPSSAEVVPREGWKVPWDAPEPEPGLLLVEPFVQQAMSPDLAVRSKMLGIDAQEPVLQQLQPIDLDSRMQQLESERQQAWAILKDMQDPEERLQYGRELLEMDEELENHLLFIDRVTLRCHEWIQEDSYCLTPRRREKAENDPRYREKLKKLYGIAPSAAGSVVDSSVTRY